MVCFHVEQSIHYHYPTHQFPQIRTVLRVIDPNFQTKDFSPFTFFTLDTCVCFGLLESKKTCTLKSSLKGKKNDVSYLFLLLKSTPSPRFQCNNNRAPSLHLFTHSSCSILLAWWLLICSTLPFHHHHHLHLGMSQILFFLSESLR